MSDFVIDMTSVGLLHTKEQVAVLEAGTRMLMVHDPVEVLERLFPRTRTRSASSATPPACARPRGSALQSDNGTEVWFDRTDSPVIEQWGWTDEPGRWDHWPGRVRSTRRRPRASGRA